MLINRSPRLADLDNDAFTRLRDHPATNQHHGQLLFALQRVVASLGHCDPPVRLGRNHIPAIEGAAAAWIGWVERWCATSTLTPKVRATIRTQMARAGRWLVAEHPEITELSQWTRQTCASWVAAVDRDAGRRPRAAPRRPRRTRRRPDLPTHQGPRPDLHQDLLPRLSGMGMVRPPLRPRPRAGGAAQRRRADRHRPEGHLRRRVGQAAVGRAEHRIRRPARQHRRHLLPDAVDPRGDAHLAVQRPAQRRTVPAAGRLRALAARRRTNHRRRPRRAGHRRRLPDRRARAQDRHRVHQTRRSAARAGHRGLASRPTRTAGHHRPQNQRTRRHALRRPRPAGCPQLHQPHDHSRAVRQGRRPRQRRAGPDHQPPCPRHHRQPALQRQGADDAVRAASLARPLCG